MNMKPLLVLAACVSTAQAVDFQTEILPIFESKCFRCHGGDEKKGGLSLEPENISRHIRGSGQIRPGNPDRSVLVELLTAEDPDDLMPARGGPLPPAQIDLIRTWIAEGAELEGGDPPAEGGVAMDEPKTPEPLNGTFINRENTPLQATAIRIDNGNVILRIPGRPDEVPYPIANLSDKTQAELQAWWNPEPAEPAEAE